MSARRLLVTSGPIARGKSTVAQLLAAEFRASGCTAPVIDLDRLYMMLDDRSPLADSRTWREVRPGGRSDEYTSRLSTALEPIFITLRVSVDEALRRVEADTGRRAWRIPDLLRRSHADFVAAATIASEVTIDSTQLSISGGAAGTRSVLDQSRPQGAADNGSRPLFRDVDCVQVPVPDLEAGLAFYRAALGHGLVWRTDAAAGLRLGRCRYGSGHPNRATGVGTEPFRGFGGCRRTPFRRCRRSARRSID
jgi:hypothetical protein